MGGTTGSIYTAQPPEGVCGLLGRSATAKKWEDLVMAEVISPHMSLANRSRAIMTILYSI